MSIARSGNDNNSSIGRQLSTWRRLVAIFGPSSAKQVALTMSEFAWAEGNSPDGALTVRHCTQQILCALCDYKSPRGLLKQIALLQEHGWIWRDSIQTGPKIYREYVLLVPASVPHSAISEFASPSRGMWSRILREHTRISGELRDTRSMPGEDETSKDRVNSSSENTESGELENSNRCPVVPEQVNSGTPLKESLRNLKEVSPFKEAFRSAENSPGSEYRNIDKQAYESDDLPELSHSEPVEQDNAVQPRALRTEYRRAVIQLNETGKFTRDEIARLVRIDALEVVSILGESGM